MKRRYTSFLFIVLLVSLLGTTAMACEDHDCPPCKAWNGYFCAIDCNSTELCCDEECWDKPCCNNDTEQCTAEDAVCCGGNPEECCYNKCCGDECCLSSTDDCCEDKCWGEDEVCCNDEQCDPTDICCGSIGCCPGECCNDMMCCGNTPGRKCCDDTACYDSGSEKCCGYGNGKICDINRECCNGSCCLVGKTCCEDISCYDASVKKCCGDGIGTVCDIGEPCCDDGTCGLCCWQLDFTNQRGGTGDCLDCENGSCPPSIESWATPVCIRSSSGQEYCEDNTYRQIGSEWACDGTVDWPNLFLCAIGEVSECAAICAAQAAVCIASLPEGGGAGCEAAWAECFSCMEPHLEGELECGCDYVICSLGDLLQELYGYRATCSGLACTSE